MCHGSYEVYSGFLYTALSSTCLKACTLQVFVGASQALCALLLLPLLLPPFLEWWLPPKLYRKITRVVCEQSGQQGPSEWRRRQRHGRIGAVEDSRG